MGHVAGRQAHQLPAKVDRIPLDPEGAHDSRGFRLVRKPQHDGATAAIGVPRRVERQVKRVGTGDDPVDHPAVRGSQFGMILLGMPAQRRQGCQSRHAGRRATVETANVRGIFEFVEIPGKRIVLREPSAGFRLKFQHEGLVHVEHPGARRSAHPFQACRHHEINLRVHRVERDQPGGLGDVHTNQAAHFTPMGDKRRQVDAGGSRRCHPGDQSEADIASPPRHEIVSFGPGLPRALRHGIQGEAHLRRQSRQQEMD